MAVVLRGGRFSTAAAAAGLRDLLEDLEGASVLGIDMPIGFPERGLRRADSEARSLVGRLHATVFPVPPRAAFEAATYARARRVAQRTWGRKLSAQSYALRRKVLELDSIAAHDHRIIEVHPEVSFRTMAGRPLLFSKRAWNGQHRRRALLAAEGIVLPEQLDEAGRVPVDDLLDAAAVAWTAERHRSGRAQTLPSDPAPGEPVIHV